MSGSSANLWSGLGRENIPEFPKNNYACTFEIGQLAILRKVAAPVVAPGKGDLSRESAHKGVKGVLDEDVGLEM